MSQDKIKNCTECKNCNVIADPDPHDWFCIDDVATVCTITPNPSIDMNSEYMSNRSEYRVIMPSIRPYRVVKESETPDWCPLNKEVKNDL